MGTPGGRFRVPVPLLALVGAGAAHGLLFFALGRLEARATRQAREFQKVTLVEAPTRNAQSGEVDAGRSNRERPERIEPPRATRDAAPLGVPPDREERVDGLPKSATEGVTEAPSSTPRAEVGDGGEVADAPRAAHGGATPDQGPVALPAAEVSRLCPRLSLDRRLRGQGFFPRRYLWTLEGREGAYVPQRLAPLEEPLPYVDGALHAALAAGCDLSGAALARVAPGRFANGKPATLTLQLEITEEPPSGRAGG